MDLASLVNAPREATLAGKTYQVSALALADWGQLQAYLKDHATDPVVAVLGQLTKARAAGIAVDPEDRKELFEAAREEARGWPPRVGSPLWFDLLNTTEGASEKFLACVLRKHQPALTDDEIAAANEAATPDESRLLIYRALGLNPDPKGPGPAEAAPTPTPNGAERTTAPTTGPGASTPSASATV